jgi:hypothetical protein
VRADTVPGRTFPDYELGVPRRLSELQSSDPMVLLLARGRFGPKDDQQHLDLAAFYSKLTVAHTRRRARPDPTGNSQHPGCVPRGRPAIARGSTLTQI